nr:hypothetical protein [uncultured Cohaesibacter sp.]
MIASLRAFEHELQTFRSVDFLESAHLGAAINKFRSELADGKSIEILRLEQAMNLLGVKQPDQVKKEKLALHIENILDKTLGKHKWKGARALSLVEAERCLFELQTEIAAYTEQDVSHFDLSGLEMSQFSEIPSIHQTWIYQDWQAANWGCNVR